jgi:hypothetical protein
MILSSFTIMRIFFRKKEKESLDYLKFPRSHISLPKKYNEEQLKMLIGAYLNEGTRMFDRVHGSLKGLQIRRYSGKTLHFCFYFLLVFAFSLSRIH